MALTKNQYGTVDLQATVADLDKRLAELEAADGLKAGDLQAAESEAASLLSRVAALESELTALRSALEPTGLPPKETNDATGQSTAPSQTPPAA
jgi:hypothetical protein